jgi:hypothetical protein
MRKDFKKKYLIGTVDTTLIIKKKIYFGNSFFNTEVTNVFPLLD